MSAAPNAYQSLKQHFGRLSSFSHISSVLQWDSSTMLAKKAAGDRAEASSELARLMHQMCTESWLNDAIAESEQQDLGEWDRANLEKIKRQVTQSSILPEDLVAAKAKIQAKSESVWPDYKSKSDWPGFLPIFKEGLDLAKEEARIRSSASGIGDRSPYESLMDLYEEGLTTSFIDPLFDALKEKLPNLIDNIRKKQNNPPSNFGDHFPVASQERLARRFMEKLGFDFNGGRLDVSAHPFCGGVPNDVRITTRYYENDFTQALMGVLHETGHALYEQGLPTEWRNQPVGQAQGMAIHESMSLLVEMQVCRGREFLTFAAPLIAAELYQDNPSSAPSVDALVSCYTQVQPGYIRVDADEVTYPLHVILRYELEKALINDELDVEDLPNAWEEKLQNYLGLKVGDRHEVGCLQDVHWPVGLYGYFPCYTLGALFAAQFFAAASNSVPDLKKNIEAGNFAPLIDWLRTNVHSKARLYSGEQLAEKITGQKLSVEAFMQHVQARYLG